MSNNTICGNCVNSIMGFCDVIQEDVSDIDLRAKSCESFQPIDDIEGDYEDNTEDVDVDDLDMDDILAHANGECNDDDFDDHGIDMDDDSKDDDSEAYK